MITPNHFLQEKEIPHEAFRFAFGNVREDLKSGEFRIPPLLRRGQETGIGDFEFRQLNHRAKRGRRIGRR